jgi:hypothetical protein
MVSREDVQPLRIPGVKQQRGLTIVLDRDINSERRGTADPECRGSQTEKATRLEDPAAGELEVGEDATRHSDEGGNRWSDRTDDSNPRWLG